MRDDLIRNVEIVDPPIGELTKGRGGFKRGCFIGCFSIFIFIIAGIIALRFAAGKGPETLTAVPNNFPKAIPVYDKDAIERITFISGKYKSRGVEIAALFPKLILSPIFLAMDKKSATSDDGGAVAQKMWQLITRPVSDAHDTIQIQWLNMDAEPTFVISYYKNELLKQRYTIEEETVGRTSKQIVFSGPDGTTGTLQADGDEENKPGTDYALLTVNLATPSNNH
jgi:hypothetical protein